MAADRRLAALAAESRARSADGEAPGLTLCNQHAWRALDLVAPGPAARLWQPVARHLRLLLQSEIESADAGPGRQWAAPLSPGRSGERPAALPAMEVAAGRTCPACRARAEAEREAATALFERNSQAPHRAEYGARLCLPHLALALRLAPGSHARRALIASEEQALKALQADLGEYIRKQNYRCREARGQEADSPWRVVSHVAGARGLGTGLLWRTVGTSRR